MHRVRPFLAGAFLIFLNAVIVHKLFLIEYSWFSFSIEGTFIALARIVSGHGIGFHWFPFWNLGIPATHAYLPLLPWTTALVSRVAHVSPALAYHWVTAFSYCVLPVTFYLFLRDMTHREGPGFFCGLAMTLLSPSALLIPAVHEDTETIFTLQRLRALVIYGAGPEIMGLAMLPLALLFLNITLRRRDLRFAVATIVLTAAIAITDVSALVALVTGGFILSLVHGRSGWFAAPMLPSAYLLVCRWVPPSLLGAALTNSGRTENADYRFAWITLTSAACLILSIAAIWWLTRNWREQPLRFALLWTALLLPIVELSASFSVNLIPQAFRFHLAMEMAVLLLLVLAVGRLPRRPVVVAACAFLATSPWLAFREYHFATRLIQPTDIRENADYRIAEKLSEFNGGRVMAAGAVGYVLNIVSDTPQFYGGHEPFNPNWINRVALYQLHTGDGAGKEDGEICALWLKVFGVQGVSVSGPGSSEHYKPFRRNPALFEGVLPVVYRAGSDTIYRVPQRTDGLAHVVPESAIVRTPPRDGMDVSGIRTYAAALDDENMPPAEYKSTALDGATIRTTIRAGEAISVQTNYHSGWRALIDGQPQPIASDGLGMIVIHPLKPGPCTIDLQFTGGMEQMITSCLSGIAAFMLLGLLTVTRYSTWPSGRIQIFR